MSSGEAGRNRGSDADVEEESMSPARKLHERGSWNGRGDGSTVRKGEHRVVVTVEDLGGNLQLAVAIGTVHTEDLWPKPHVWATRVLPPFDPGPGPPLPDLFVESERSTAEQPPLIHLPVNLALGIGRGRLSKHLEESTAALASI